MIKWAVICLVAAAIAGLFGFKNVETAMATASKFLVFVALVVVLLLLLFNVLVTNT